MIVRSSAFFSHADQFNDPFDCKIRFNQEATDDNWRRFFNERLRKDRPELTTVQIEMMIEQKIRDPQLRDEKYLDEIDDQNTRDHLNKVGIFSLSADPAQMLMWSHYSDSHRGCCLQFSTDYKFFLLAQSVSYSPTYPNVNFFQLIKDKNVGEFIKIALLTKSDLWKYEQEWRILEFDGPRRFYPFDVAGLTGVIFGYWMKPEDKDLIRRLTEKRNPPLQFYQAMPWKREFKMQIVPLP
jgi:hypothetical protein